MGLVLWPLALAQTLVWASTFYLFPALLPAFERESDWSKAELTGAFTLALLATACVSPLSGKLIDRGFGQSALLVATVVAALALAGLNVVGQLWQFYLCWLVIGACMGTILYETCFAILTRSFGLDAKPMITRITLIAGLAGTVSFPTAGFLATHYGWRVTVLWAAGALLVAVLPLSFFAFSHLKKHDLTPLDTGNGTEAKENENGPANRRGFLLIALGFTLVTLSHTMMITHLLPLLQGRGIAESTAVVMASMIGPMQVAGRLVMVATEKRATIYGSTVFCFTGMLVAVLLLSFAGARIELVVLFVVLHGGAWGTLSILRPMLTREALGGIGFGYNSGRISAIGWLGSTIAPFGGALLWQWNGYPAMLTVCIGLTIVALLALLALKSSLRQADPN